MKIQILGCGTSTGVPIPGCDCAVCCSNEVKNQRSRTSSIIKLDDGRNILIDASTDLRWQALRWQVKNVNAVLYTHSHADHILGTDDLRCFNFIQKEPIPCYGTSETYRELKSTFRYIFDRDPSWEGGLLTHLEWNTVEYNKPFLACNQQILPLQLKHGRSNVTAYKFGNLVYATDCNLIPETTWSAISGIDVLILDALRFEPHKTHFTINEAIEIAQQLGVRKTYLVHMTHTVDYVETSKILPPNVELAYDGLEIEL